MEQSEFNSLQMMKTVDAVFTSNPNSWNHSAPVVKRFTDFKALLSTIEQHALIRQNSNTSGYTEQKNKQKEALVDLAYAVAIKLKAFASETENSVMKQDVDYSKSDLRKGKDEIFVNRCKTILKIGQDRLTDLADYGITAELLAEFQTATEAYAPLVTNRDTVQDQKSVYTDSLHLLFDEARKSLHKLDDLVEGVLDDKLFKAAYQEARMTTDRRKRGKAKSGNPE